MAPKPSSTAFQQYLPLITAVILVLIGIVGFYKQLPQNPQTQPQSTTLQEVTQPNAFFNTPAVYAESHIEATVSFKFKAKPIAIWLNLLPKSGQQFIQRLVFHPQLFSLDWPTLTSDSLTLHQKIPTYKSIEEFIKNPPSSDQVLMDPKLTTNPAYSHITSNQIEDTIKQDTYSYILTTYLPSNPDETGQYTYQTDIDATTAYITDDNKMRWLILANQATPENSFYLGGVNISYLQ